MLMSSVDFGPWAPEKAAADEQREAVASYFGSLSRNGQISDDLFYARVGGRCVAHVALARPDAFERQHHSAWGLTHLDRVTAAFSQSPRWTVLEDDTADAESTWEGAGALVFYTHLLDKGAPVMRGDDGRGVATYLLPISDDERQALQWWAWAYRAHDEIWMGSSALEIPAYKQMAEPDSALSRDGRDLARAIEAATGLPTYYYLIRYWGRRTGEEDRRCPSCGEPWRVPFDDEARGLRSFPFRCEPCRLVSHDASTTNDERHARLGEYRRKPSRP